MNELIFFMYIFVVSTAALVAVRLGKEALVALIAVQAVLVNLFVIKQIELFGLTATASDALAVGATLCLNLLQEYYGQPIAKKAVWISFFCALFYTGIGLLHIAYLPCAFDTSNTHFVALLSPMPRIIIASLSVYLLVQNIEIRLYAFLQKYFNNKHFIIRNYTSVAITQLIDTVLFSFLGLYGILSNIGHIIIISYAIKLIIIFTTAPFLLFSKKISNVQIRNNS